MTHPPSAATPRRRIALGVSKFVLDYLVALPLGCVVALTWANTLPESYFRFATAAAFPVNAIGMAFFFALITKEVTEATLPGGPLHPWHRATLPVIAAIGGAAASVVCYLAFSSVSTSSCSPPAGSRHARSIFRPAMSWRD